MIFNCWGVILAVIGMAPLIATPIGVALRVAYLATFEREWRGCKIVVGDYCSSQQLYSILYLTSLIIFFLIKNIELLK